MTSFKYKEHVYLNDQETSKKTDETRYNFDSKYYFRCFSFTDCETKTTIESSYDRIGSLHLQGST